MIAEYLYSVKSAFLCEEELACTVLISKFLFVWLTYELLAFLVEGSGSLLQYNQHKFNVVWQCSNW